MCAISPILIVMIHNISRGQRCTLHHRITIITTAAASAYWILCHCSKGFKHINSFNHKHCRCWNNSHTQIYYPFNSFTFVENSYSENNVDLGIKKRKEKRIRFKSSLLCVLAGWPSKSFPPTWKDCCVKMCLVHWIEPGQPSSCTASLSFRGDNRIIFIWQVRKKFS